MRPTTTLQPLELGHDPLRRSRRMLRVFLVVLVLATIVAVVAL